MSRPTTGSPHEERELLEAFLALPLGDVDPELDDRSRIVVGRLLAREQGPDSDGDAVFNSVV